MKLGTTTTMFFPFFFHWSWFGFIFSDEIYSIECIKTYEMKEKKRTHIHTRTSCFTTNFGWIYVEYTQFERKKNLKKMLCLSAGRWSVRWIRYNEMHIPFYSFLFGGACVSFSLSFSPFIRLFASNLNFPFVYLFDSFIVVVAFLHFVVFCFILCSFFIYLSISFCRSWITLLFWL